MVARGVPAEAAAVSAAAALNLTESSSNWWHDINESPVWQDRIFQILAVLYGIVAAVALVQLVRIQLRVPEYGWTTQKVFHFLNCLVNGVRCLVFIFRRNVQKLQPEIVQHILLDMPSLAFFTTYALLVLFWAEIYYQARAVSTDGLRPSFYTINAVVYVIQIALWLILWWKPISVLLILSKVFFAGVSLFAALGFLLYGGRLFLMLQRFPVESKGRRKKLQEETEGLKFRTCLQEPREIKEFIPGAYLLESDDAKNWGSLLLVAGSRGSSLTRTVCVVENLLI